MHKSRLFLLFLTSAACFALSAGADADLATSNHRSGARVPICHRPPGRPTNAHTLRIGSRAVRPHLAHGDTVGPCCTDNSDCVEGEICDVATGSCRPPTTTTLPSTTTTTLEPVPCTDNADCPPGQICNAATGQCETPSTTTTMPAHPCGSDEDCAELETTCAAGVCNPAIGACGTEPRNNGAECDSTETDACSVGGICSDGRCIGLPLCDPECSLCDAGNCVSLCGNPWQPVSTGITVADALFILRASVELEHCAVCVCDVEGSASVSAVDCLLVLRKIVGLPETLSCPEHADQSLP